MKELNIKQLIYLCKNHDTDKNINIMLGATDREIVKKLVELKQAGLYEKYKNMSEEEYEKIIKREKLEKIENAEKKEKINNEGKNNLQELNDILFTQLHTLMRDDLTEHEFKQTVETSKQVVNVSQTIINNASLLFQAKKHFDITGTNNNEVAPLLRLND